MRLTELEHGMAVELRDGTRCIVIAYNYSDTETKLSLHKINYGDATKSEFTNLIRYYDDMRHKEYRNYDIVKVWSNSIALFSLDQPRIYEREDFKVGDLVWSEGLLNKRLGVITEIDLDDPDHTYRVMVQKDLETDGTLQEWTNHIEKVNLKEEIYNG